MFLFYTPSYFNDLNFNILYLLHTAVFVFRITNYDQCISFEFLSEKYVIRIDVSLTDDCR